MNKLEESKQKKLKKIKMWKDHEHRLIFDWFASQKKQAWNDFYVSLLQHTYTVYFITSPPTKFDRKKARTMLIEQVHTKMLRIRQELSQLNMKCKEVDSLFVFFHIKINHNFDSQNTISRI